MKKVSDIVAEIAAASREQSSGIEQVNRAIMQMDELTQQNAALVEQATAASQAMAQQAGELNEMMTRYHLADSASIRAATPRPADAAAAAVGGGATAPTPATAKAGQRSERRGASRPWTRSSTGRAAAAEGPREPVESRKVSAAPDSDWQEF